MNHRSNNTNYPLIVIPAVNESGTIGQVINRTQTCVPFDILVVDDGSQDNTVSIARDSGAQALSLPFNIGAWGAIQTGMGYALERGYPAVVTMDADDQHAPEDIHKLLAPLGNRDSQNSKDRQFDLVIGACLDRGSLCKSVAWYILKKASMLGIQDLTSGFRSYNRYAMTLLLNRDSMVLDYQDIGVLMLLRKNHCRIKEVTVCMQPRKNGISRIYKNLAAIAGYFFSTLILIGIKRW